MISRKIFCGFVPTLFEDSQILLQCSVVSFNMVIGYYNKQDKKSRRKKPHWSLKFRGCALEQ